VAIDWEAKTGAPLVAVFGEPATFVPASNAPSYPVTGVFDDEFRSSTIIDPAAPTTDSLPVFGVNQAQFLPTTLIPTKALPVQNDKLVFPAGPFKHSGKSYLIKEPRSDEHGIWHLVLNETAP